jgi:uncharacterized protein
MSNFKTLKVKLFNLFPKTVTMPENQQETNSKKNLSVLITGGSGLIGKHLTLSLTDAGYNVSHLSRNTSSSSRVKVFKWDPATGTIDPYAFEGIDFIIHLAGANIGEKRWTGKRKAEISGSRINTATFLHKIIKDKGIPLKAFISASATGIYGAETSQKIYCENDPPADDFLGSVCKQWEDAADLFSESGIRTVKIRTAIVLNKNDSALSKLMKPGKFGFLLRTGTGRQYMPWIHITDLCNIYQKSLEESSMSGAFNATAPEHVSHNDFMNVLARVMKRPLFPFAVPEFILKTAFGEMSDIILKGSRVSSKKIIKSGYRFLFNNLEDALNDIIKE